MTLFTASPFSLAIDAPIVAVAEARNAKGYSIPSVQVTTGAKAQTVPTQGPAATRGSATTSTSLEVTWPEITSSPANGGAVVTAFRVYWDKGLGGATNTWELAATTGAGITRSVTASGITAG